MILRRVAVIQCFCCVLSFGAAAASEGLFSDVDGSVHSYSIGRVAEWGIDEGCGDGRFCPSQPISRAEAAAWLHRATVNFPPTPTPPPQERVEFLDVADDAWYLTYARWAVDSNIMTVTGGYFDPDGSVTRANMAEMLVAAFDHLSASPQIQGIFADTGSTPEAAVSAIEGIHAVGITKGCDIGPLRYCPDEEITRGQAAAFVARAMRRAEPTVGLIANQPESAQGYTLLNSERFKTVYLIDNLGREVHTWTAPEGLLIRTSELLENGNLLTRIRSHVPTPHHDPHIAELSPTGSTVWSYSTDTHHELLKMPNGNVLLLKEGRITQEEAIAAGADPKNLTPAGLSYDYLIEVRPTGPSHGEIVWEWSMLDHLIQDHDPTKPNYGAIAENPGRIDINYNLSSWYNPADWSHVNAVDYNPVLDQIMISVRNYSELWIIDHNTTTDEAAGEKGDLLYRWGNPRAYGVGSYEDQELFYQHNTHWIPPGLPGEGNVLIFNNGYEFPGFERLYSSIDEISLPPSEDNIYPRTLDGAFKAPDHVWTYIHPTPTDFYSPVSSSAQRLPNGNTLILDDHKDTISQVTPDGTIVWRYISPLLQGQPFSPGYIPGYQGDPPDSVLSQPHWYPSDYPGLKSLDLTPKGPIELYR